MKHGKTWLLAAGLLAGAAALTGCTAKTSPVATPTPQAAAKATAAPLEPSESPSESPEAEETPGPIPITAAGVKLERTALEEEDRLWLPLVETAAALGWQAEEKTEEAENGSRRTVTLSKGESLITVSWLSADNTARQITWQKDGLLIPVDPALTTLEGTVYVPAAFFEEAADVTVKRAADGIEVTPIEPKDTPETQGT